MPYDDVLAGRIRAALDEQPAVIERKMFGGLAFMVNGNMCCGLVGSDLVARVGPDQYEEALGKQHARPMDFTGRQMRGFVYVAPEGWSSERDLRTWVDMALRFVLSLPAK
jgi:TfoX/Sxy family transcriptional regulator of competence genes